MQLRFLKPAFIQLCLLSSAATTAVTPTVAAEPALRLRRPVALACIDSRLYVANRRAGTVSIVDTASRKVVDEVVVGRQLSDLIATPDGRFLLATDEGSHQLVLLKPDGDALTVAGRIDVAPFPVSVLMSGESGRCSVASLWSRQMTFVDLTVTANGDDATGRLSLFKKLDLPFAPRKQLQLPGGNRLLVADSHGGKLAVVDPSRSKVIRIRSITGHNIRGLAFSHDGSNVLLAQQVLNADSTTTHEHVFWGGVILNLIRSVPLTAFQNAKAEENLAGSPYHLGRPGSATGDPASIVTTSRGQTIVALAGVDEIAFRPSPLEPFNRLKVGRRPTALVTNESEDRLYVANTFADSISIIDLPKQRVAGVISLGLQPKLSDADRGEMLFHAARLSLDGWYSCHSCHTDGHTNGLKNDNFGDGYYGDPKSVVTLRGVANTKPWAWNGRADNLEKQIQKSMTVTMQGESVERKQVQALAAYLRTLKPAPALDKLRGRIDTRAVRKGRQIFAKQGCIDCHRGPTYTTPAIYDVGLYDKYGTKRFNPPSLRGLSQRSPYFHDGRAANLRDVLIRHRHGLSRELSPADRDALIAFLRSL